MADDKTILVIGTYDTKSDELEYLADRIRTGGGKVVTMDVSVLGNPTTSTDISKHDVAAAAGSSVSEVTASGDENSAMQIMAAGASALTRKLHGAGRIDGMVATGGTMGTDLALDCARALPLGVPKVVISTVSFSPLIPPHRLSPDLQMILWAGGLYGLNSVCKSSLSQAAGAVLGAARIVEPPRRDRPVIGMMALGSSVLRYMNLLKRPLEERGFEVAVFHATGMGGMAFENLCKEGYFACVMDFALPELGNLMVDSIVSAGNDRMLNAGRTGIPQIVAPGAIDLVDFAAWRDVPERFRDRVVHAHNRLIASAPLTPDERRELARDIGWRLSQSIAPVHFLLPKLGVEEWDRAGRVAHDPAGLEAFIDEIRKALPQHVARTELDCHINDQAFADAALAVLDDWIAKDIVKREA
jgi:uncharacterized protein (UPF0261 family)